MNIDLDKVVEGLGSLAYAVSVDDKGRIKGLNDLGRETISAIRPLLKVGNDKAACATIKREMGATQKEAEFMTTLARHHATRSK